jgi:hypothetical protein
MVSPQMKRKAERRLRQLLSEDGFAQPDEVQYGPDSLLLIWRSVNKSIEVDVTEKGEVGETRMGPPPLGSGEPATLKEKLAVERKLRALLTNGGLPQPDEVEYGHRCIRAIWWDQQVAVVVDLDDRPSDDELGDAMSTRACTRADRRPAGKSGD